MAHKRKGTFINSGIVSENRRARYDYFIEGTVDAGLVLMGSEVKSLRLGRCTITECYAGLQKNELYLLNAYIPEYQGGATLHFGHESRRPRKLLLRQREIRRLHGMIIKKGMTIIPISLYFNNRGLAKVRLGIARGKRLIDKRDVQRKRDWQREKARLMRERP